MTTRIIFELKINDDDFGDKNPLFNKHGNALTDIKAKLESTLTLLGHEIERSKLTIFEENGMTVDQKQLNNGTFVLQTEMQPMSDILKKYDPFDGSAEE